MMSARVERYGWISSAAAALAFAATVAVFALQTRLFHKSTVEWAERNLSAQAELAARTLRQPLREQDFRRIGEFGESCRNRGLGLLVTSSPGGTLFDSRGPSAAKSGGRDLSASADCGEYVITLFLPSALVHEPFVRAIPVLALSALSGIAGMFVLFFALYRQRVRIRELARLEKFRRDFVADVSHEIKTPLTGILAASEMLGDVCKDPRAAELTGMISRQSRRLDSLVREIIGLSKLERPGWKMESSQVDLEELLRPLALKHGCVFSVHDRMAQVRCDPSLVTEAVENLVSNAVRHSGSADITLALGMNGDSVEIAVEDHGVGIPQQDAKRVFERFFRVDRSRDTDTGGSGLGLAIVQRIASLHGGEVRLFPVDPSGCRFVFSFEPGRSSRRFNGKRADKK